MLDPKLLRDNPKIVRESVKKRGMDPKQVDLFLELDKKWRSIKVDNDNLRSRRNKISQEINLAKKEGKAIEPILKKLKEIPQKLERNDKLLGNLEQKRNTILENFPNIVDSSVPTGDATKNKILKVVIKPKKMKFTPKGHEELLTNLDQLDISRAAKVAGARFYYLKRDIARLNYALITFALDYLNKKEFIIMQPPYMIKRGKVRY